jgi:hypothetical protein
VTVEENKANFGEYFILPDVVEEGMTGIFSMSPFNFT